jgi:hypothetical protein
MSARNTAVRSWLTLLALLVIAPRPATVAAGTAPANDSTAGGTISIEDLARRYADTERPRFPYLPGARQQTLQSPRFLPLQPPPTVGPYVSIQANVSAPGVNIPGDAANEPSLTVDPTAPNRMAIGWRQFDNVASDFRQAGYGFSRDGGRTWTFPGVIDPGVFRSDPVLDTDADGLFHFMSLKISLHMDLFSSADGGSTWGAPVDAVGGDKEWMAVDRTGGTGRGNVYSSWQLTSPFSPNQLTRSSDGGASFETPSLLPSRPFFGTMTVASDGALYVCGTDAVGAGAHFHVLRSDDAQNPAVVPPTFALDQIVDLDGLYTIFAGVNPIGSLGQPWVAENPANGDIYLLCSVDPPGTDPLDIHFSRSTDRGLTWSAPVRVNDDTPGNNAWQWFGTMSVAPNGRIDVIWNDTRNDPANPAPTTSELFYSFSSDGGVSWSPNIPVSPPFQQGIGYPQQNKLGDYYHMISDRLGAHVAYAATHNGEEDIWYLRIGDYDCNRNGVADATDIANATSKDCNLNGIPDECEIASGASHDVNHNDIPDECETIAAQFDIKPGACPNPLNVGSHGVLPTALVGTSDIAAADVNLATVRLVRSDGTGGSVAPLNGPPGPSPQIADVATPFPGTPCDCHTLEGDGVADLMLKFSTDDLATTLLLSSEHPGAQVKLKLTGQLLNGLPFAGEDCISIVPQVLHPHARPLADGPEAFDVQTPELNPLASRLSIRYVMPVSGAVSATVHDLLGRQVRTLLAGAEQGPGDYQLPWDGADDQGARLASGVYLIRFEMRPAGANAAAQARTVRAVLVR